jgi:hypothetical protein
MQGLVYSLNFFIIFKPPNQERVKWNKNNPLTISLGVNWVVIFDKTLASEGGGILKIRSLGWADRGQKLLTLFHKSQRDLIPTSRHNFSTHS